MTTVDWLRPLDLYCERIGPGLWAEPLNALTNLAFLVAAFVVWRRLALSAQSDAPRRYLQALAALVVCIGIGSGLFHTTARVWSSILDVLFISLFIYSFFGYFLHFVARLPWSKTVPALAAFLALNWLVGRAFDAALPREVLNGSEDYLPPLLALAAIGSYMRLRRLPGSARLLAAAGVFALSVSLRSVDQRWCAALPLGTHFLWHLLNAWVLYQVVAGMIDALGAGASTPSGPTLGRRAL